MATKITSKKKYKFAAIATDVAILTIKEGKLQILLIKMKKKPYEKCWAIPGGLVNPNESVDQAAGRILLAKTGLKNVYLEQLYSFGDVNRDPFGRVVSVAYFSLLPEGKFNLKTTKEHGEIQWFPVDEIPSLAYDHSEILKKAYHRLKAKLEYSNIAYSLLPANFALSELQEIYEIILKRKLDKRNFRKKILSLGMVKKSGKKQKGLPNRPADLYSFAKKSACIVNIL